MGAPAQLEPDQIARKVESARRLLLNFAVVLIGILMLLLGGILTLFALPASMEWSALGGPLKFIVLSWLVAGPVVLGCGVWLIVSLGRYTPPLWVGSAGMFAPGILMVAGVLSHVVPCAGPT